MSYKVKSALYFISFLAAVTLYYGMDNNIKFDTIEENMELAEADMQNGSSNIIAVKDLK